MRIFTDLPVTRFIKANETGVSTARFTKVCNDICLFDKYAMAEALIAKDHFYVNASYYNDTETDQAAVITVADKDDILRRDQGDEWLVHVTRFSCDSMNSLSYIDADVNATWQIIAKDGAGFSHQIWDFTLDRDFATPRDMISAMNMQSRWGVLGATITSDKFEIYRFELDAGGRFRLRMAFDQHVTNGWHISYSGSAAMNKLLGFEQITPFLSYIPDPAAQFCKALEFLERECNAANTILNVKSGNLWRDTNNVLVELLNGLEIRNSYMGQYGGCRLRTSHI